MRNRLKRATAVAITVVMLLTLLSASLAAGDGEVLSAPVFPGLEDGGALLSAVNTLADGDSITVTFDYGNEQTVTISTSSTSTLGDVIYELPEYKPVDNYYLWDWTYTDGDNTIVATVDTALADGMTFTAVYQQAYKVTCYDIQPDGTDGTESGDIDVDGDEGVTVDDGGAGSNYYIDFLVPVNMTLQEYFDTYDDPTWNDNTHFSDCVWRDANDNRVNLSDSVTADMNLYTYTYRIVLTLSPTDAQAAIASYSMVDVTTATDGTLTLTITAREGEKLKASDFVVDGVDYSLYTWTDEAGKTVDIQALITNGVTGNITATSDGTLGITQREVEITFYVCVDDEWQSTTQTVTAYWLTNAANGVSNDSWFLTSGQLQSVYGKYGFAGMEEGKFFFPHALSSAPNTLWSDRASQKVGNVVYSPIVNTEASSCCVYYLPNGYEYSGGKSRDNLAAANTFYTVTVSDPGQNVYTADTLPAVTYTLKGEDATMTVEAPGGVTWQCVGQDGNTATGTVNDDETVTFTIEDISQPYVISPVYITYNINLPKTPADAEYGTPQIEGGSTYTVLADGEHTVLAPSLLSYFYNITDGETDDRYQGVATFTGWKIEGTEEVLQPGVSLDWTQYGGTSITLLAQWTVKDSGITEKTGSMVNFFVALNALPEGTTGWTGNTDKSTFTTSVYSTDCGIDGTTVQSQELYATGPIYGYSTQYYVLGGTSGTNLDENHDNITRNLSAGYEMTGKYDGNKYTYKATFPSDETVLRKIRTMVANGTVITINNHTITEDELTTANFTIKWYVFKYDDGDGWHIDGILVAKKGQLVVTKTFAGDEEAIEKVKNNGYSILVTGGSVNTYSNGLSLTDSDVVQSGNTYTWTLDVDQYYDYTFTENNYTFSENLYTSNALYRVRNARIPDSAGNSRNTGGWVSYSSGVTVTGQGHNEGDSERLTVSFLNTYTAPGTVILQKVDAATGNLMPNVSFTIAKTGDSEFSMYDKGNGSYSAESGSGTKTNTITTDSTGQAYLWIGGGTYTLQEQVPTGYDDPGTITVPLTGDSSNNYKVISIGELSAGNGSKFVATGDNLTVKVKNYSRTIDLKVTKIWEGGENKPVTIQLYRKDVPMGSDYTVTFDGTVDSVETQPWTHTFTGLPLYADGALAQYTLREEALGDFKYSSEFTGGYQYYDVTYSGMSYLANGSETTDMSVVDTIALSVTNKRSSGSMTITKVDNFGVAVPGAVFHLYEAPNTDASTPAKGSDGTWNVLSGMTASKTATSDANGRIDFGTVAAGRYYIVESSAPTGYTASTDLYSIQVSSGGGSKLQVWNAETSKWVEMTENKIVNKRNTASVTISKTVTGNMGDRSKAFEFTVRSDKAMGEGTNYTLTDGGLTATFSLSHGESVILQKVPIGATLTVTETNATGYTVTVSPNTQGSTGNALTITADRVENGNVNIDVVNSKYATPDTGVFLDSLPYVLILGCVAVVIILLLVRRRRDRDDR